MSLSKVHYRLIFKIEKNFLDKTCYVNPNYYNAYGNAINKKSNKKSIINL
ncbi:hypothetical protein LCAC16_PA150003 [Leuconostoc carnosum]|nr:hypothetical protein LCAC16_PA150003 [Leuconostoc carnosum]